MNDAPSFLDLLDATEVAAIIGCAPATLAKRRMREGAGPRFLRVGRRVAYRRADVLAWVDAQFRNSTADRRVAA